MANFRVFTLALVLASIPVRANGQTLGAPETVVVQNGALALRGLLGRPWSRRRAGFMSAAVQR